jgi:hypothetical protein
MVEHCRQAYPAAHVQVGNLADRAGWPAGRFDVVWAPDNVIDVLDDPGRQALLHDLADHVGEDGLLVFASHNLDSVGHEARLGWVRRLASTPPVATLRGAARAPRRWRNRRTLVPLEHRGPHFAVINDEAHDHALLHYYIRRDDQERQLAANGWRLVEAVTLDGQPVSSDEVRHAPSVYYVARKAPPG